ncbi:MAG: hypothetical protein IPL49_15310 [Saprospirales bacterium]|nr:hypothetical protein [Saprospirales bacterium]
MAPLKISGDYYGEVNTATAVKLEDGSTKNGIELVPGEKAASRVYGEFAISEMPGNPVFTAYLGFRNAKESGSVEGEVTCEIKVQKKDGTYKMLGIKSKKYNGKLLKLEYPIDPVDTRKIRIDIISKKKGKNKVVLVNPLIVKK